VTTVDIWIKGSRFRVRDESGRHISEMLADLRAPRGLGEPPASLEHMMDIWSQSREAVPAPTELYGDRATGVGRVRERGADPWEIPAGEIAPIAEQILAQKRSTNLERGRDVARLGRRATEYHGFLEGELGGVRWRSEFTQVVSPPYLLHRHVSDAQSPRCYYTREIISLEEGIVGDADVMAPRTR
jgi:hypothetical protein